MNGDGYGSGCFIALFCFVPLLLCGEHTLPHYSGTSSAWFPLAQKTIESSGGKMFAVWCPYFSE